MRPPATPARSAASVEPASAAAASGSAPAVATTTGRRYDVSPASRCARREMSSSSAAASPQACGRGRTSLVTSTSTSMTCHGTASSSADRSGAPAPRCRSRTMPVGVARGTSTCVPPRWGRSKCSTRAPRRPSGVPWRSSLSPAPIASVSAPPAASRRTTSRVCEGRAAMGNPGSIPVPVPRAHSAGTARRAVRRSGAFGERALPACRTPAARPYSTNSSRAQSRDRWTARCHRR